MTRFALTLQFDTAAELAAVVAYLGRMPSAELPVRVRDREPGDDEPDEPVRPAKPDPPPPPPPPKPKAPTGRNATPVYDGVPRSGKALYKWGCDHKCLPAVNGAGKALSYPRLVSDWDESQVARVFGQLGGAT